MPPTPFTISTVPSSSKRGCCSGTADGNSFLLFFLSLCLFPRFLFLFLLATTIGFFFFFFFLRWSRCRSGFFQTLSRLLVRLCCAVSWAFVSLRGDDGEQRYLLGWCLSRGRGWKRRLDNLSVFSDGVRSVRSSWEISRLWGKFCYGWLCEESGF